DASVGRLHRLRHRRDLQHHERPDVVGLPHQISRIAEREGDHGRACLERVAKCLVSNVCGMWLIANGRLVSFLTVSMSGLMAAGVGNGDPPPPRPPSFDTAAASPADVQMPMGAKMIGTSMPNRSQRGVFSICRLQAATSDEGGVTIPHVLSPTCASAATRGGD